MTYVVQTKPSAEPLSLADAKAHLRVTWDDEDTLISALTVAAREYAETYTRRKFITQKWRLYLDYFPTTGTLTGLAPNVVPFIAQGVAPELAFRQLSYGTIHVEDSPIQSIDAIHYLDLNGVETLLDPSQYIDDLSPIHRRITPSYGTSWPAARPQMNAIWVDYTVGYGADGSAVPSGILAAMKMHVGSLYAFRESIASGISVAALPKPASIDALLWNHRAWSA